MTTETALVTTNSPSHQDWAILATEAAAVLLILLLIIGLISWLSRRKRINAARTLLDDRDELAESATETFHTHVQAIASGKTLTADELDDYEQRSQQLINELVKPWLEPSAEDLREAARQIMTIRHNDLHQIAAILRQQSDEAPIKEHVPSAEIQILKDELLASQKAEAERSAQLAEALKSLSIIVSEYGRKFGIDADFRAPQILRALVYLQSIEEGSTPQQAVAAANTSMASIEALDGEPDEDIVAEEIQIDSLDSQPPLELNTNVTEGTQEQAEQHESTTTSLEEEPLKTENSSKTDQTEKTEKSDGVKEEHAPSEHQPAPEAAPKKPDGPGVSDESPTHEHVSKNSEVDEPAIDLDAIELPEKAPESGEFNLDLDDIDALLDAEINKQKEKAATAPPGLDDDELDLSKKP